MVTVVALREFRYGDRVCHAGDDVQMSPTEASVYSFAQFVSLLGRPSYLTREMVAAAPVPVVAVVTAEAAPVMKRRRRGRRSRV